MPRKYVIKTGRRNYTEDEREAAINHYRIQGSIAKASRLSGVPLRTLGKWVKDPKRSLGCGRTTVLQEWEESDIVDVIVYLGDEGFPMNRTKIRTMVQCYCKDTKKRNPFPNDRPGDDWVVLFEKRWSDKFTRRVREGLNYNRTRALTSENVATFYDKFKYLLDTHNIKPSNMWNSDESGFQPCDIDAKVFVGKDVKNAYSLQSPGGKQTFTVLFACNAAGDYLKPFTIYKSAHLWMSWMQHGVEGALYSCNESGWMLDINFTKWFCEVFLPNTKSGDEPRLLIFDGHNSHISYRVAKAAKDADVHLLCLPPHSSHALQPLDVAVFRSLKACWSEVCLNFFVKNPSKTLGKDDFPACLKVMYNHLVANPQFTVNGFKKCGFRPFNPRAVDDKIVGPGRCRPRPVSVERQKSDEKHKKDLINSIRDFVTKYLRPQPRQTAVTRRKVQAVSGEILTSEESLERLRLEDEEKAAGRGRGRGRGRGGAASLGPPPGIPGAMDRFVTRGASSSGVQAPPEGGDGDGHITVSTNTQQSSLSSQASASLSSQASDTPVSSKPNMGRNRGKTSAKKKQFSLYKEYSTTTDEESADDPTTDRYSFANVEEVRRKVKVNSHLIFKFHGQEFPAMVVKVCKTRLFVRRLKPVMPYKGLWAYVDATNKNVCEFDEITDLIPPPELYSSSRIHYTCQKIGKYWTIVE